MIQGREDNPDLFIYFAIKERSLRRSLASDVEAFFDRSLASIYTVSSLVMSSWFHYAFTAESEIASECSIPKQSSPSITSQLNLYKV
jgi:hypothetical protein